MGRKYYVLLILPPTFHWLQCSHMVHITMKEAGKLSLAPFREKIRYSFGERQTFGESLCHKVKIWIICEIF